MLVVAHGGVMVRLLLMVVLLFAGCVCVGVFLTVVIINLLFNYNFLSYFKG